MEWDGVSSTLKTHPGRQTREETQPDSGSLGETLGGDDSLSSSRAPPLPPEPWTEQTEGRGYPDPFRTDFPAETGTRRTRRTFSPCVEKDRWTGFGPLDIRVVWGPHT